MGFHVICVKTRAVDVVGKGSQAVVSRSDDKSVMELVCEMSLLLAS